MLQLTEKKGANNLNSGCKNTSYNAVRTLLTML
jgi:hypothetical protein